MLVAGRSLIPFAIILPKHFFEAEGASAIPVGFFDTSSTNSFQVHRHVETSAASVLTEHHEARKSNHD